MSGDGVTQLEALGTDAVVIWLGKVNAQLSRQYGGAFHKHRADGKTLSALVESPGNFAKGVKTLADKFGVDSHMHRVQILKAVNEAKFGRNVGSAGDDSRPATASSSRPQSAAPPAAPSAKSVSFERKEPQLHASGKKHVSSGHEVEQSSAADYAYADTAESAPASPERKRNGAGAGAEATGSSGGDADVVASPRTPRSTPGNTKLQEDGPDELDELVQGFNAFLLTNWEHGLVQQLSGTSESKESKSAPFAVKRNADGFPLGTLIVSVIEAKAMRATEFWGKQDPFVRVQLGSQKKRTDTKKERSNAVRWNEQGEQRTMAFMLRGEADERDLVLSVRNEAQTGIKESEIGSVSIPIDRLFNPDLSKPFWATLKWHSTPAGQIRIATSYLPPVSMQVVCGRDLAILAHDGKQAPYVSVAVVSHSESFVGGGKTQPGDAVNPEFKDEFFTVSSPGWNDYDYKPKVRGLAAVDTTNIYLKVKAATTGPDWDLGEAWVPMTLVRHSLLGQDTAFFPLSRQMATASLKSLTGFKRVAKGEIGLRFKAA